MTLKELVTSVRDKTGYTQQELGAAIGADGQTISNIETGVTRTMKRSRLRKLAEIAGLPVEEVLAMAREAAVKPSISEEQMAVASFDQAISVLEKVIAWMKPGKEHDSLKKALDAMQIAKLRYTDTGEKRAAAKPRRHRDQEANE